MENQKWTVVKNLARATLEQFIKSDATNLITLYDGKHFYQTSADSIEYLNLPVGLSALGFTKVTSITSWPAIFEDRHGNKIIEKEKEFFIGDTQIQFTHEVQQHFDLFHQLDINDNLVE